MLFILKGTLLGVLQGRTERWRDVFFCDAACAVSCHFPNLRCAHFPDPPAPPLPSHSFSKHLSLTWYIALGHTMPLHSPPLTLPLSLQQQQQPPPPRLPQRHAERAPIVSCCTSMHTMRFILVIAASLLSLRVSSVRASPLRGSRGTYSPFVVGGNPLCFSSAELAAYNIVPLSDGARIPYGLKKVGMERNPWAGHFLSSALAAILLEETLNLPVQTDDQSSVDASVYQRLADGTTDVNMEIWRSGHTQDTQTAQGGCQ